MSQDMPRDMADRPVASSAAGRTGESPPGTPARATAQVGGRLATPLLPVEVLAVASLVIGVAALILGFIPATHFLGTLAGMIGLPLALYSQMMSVTTNQRWLNVLGMVTAFVGAGFGLRHGGFSL